MAIPVILKGDTSRAIPLALSADFDYSGCRLYADFCDIRHTFVDFGASDALELRFDANSTSRMPLGTSKVFLTLVNGAGEEMQLPWAKIKVTDSPSEVRAAPIAVDPGTLDVDELPTRFTDQDVKSRLDAIIRWMKRTAVALAVFALPAMAGTITVQTAPKGTIYNDEPVVTNVALDVGGVFAAMSNGVEAVAGSRADRALGAFAQTGTVARASSYGTPNRWADATGCVWEVGEKYPATVSLVGVRNYSYNGHAGDTHRWGSSVENYISYTDSTAEWMYYNAQEGVWMATRSIVRGEQVVTLQSAFNPSSTVQLSFTSHMGETNLVGRVAMTNDIPAVREEEDPNVWTWARQPVKPGYTAEEVGAYPAEDGAELASIVNLWEGYWGGTNVIFEVTNYYGNTSGEIPRLRVKELREGTWHTVWDEADKFDVCYTSILWQVAHSNAAVLEAVADGYAPKAWGCYTDKGGTNVVGNSVWHTAPQTYFAGGMEYQRVAVGAGSVCVLVERGASAYTAGEAGTFRFQDEGGTNYFGFAKSDSFTIGCKTDGITVDGNLVTLRYDVIMGGEDVPIVYWRAALGTGSWTQLNNTDGTAADGAPYTVTWYQSGGSYYAAINCGSNPSGFFTAETSVMGDVVFETNMKMRMDGGIVCTNTATGVNGVIRPTYNGSTVNWTWSAR